jgi:hypothetical protein
LKKYFIILFLLSAYYSYAQEGLINQKIYFQQTISSEKDLIYFLQNHFSNFDIAFDIQSKNSSLTATHYTLAVKYRNTKLYNIYLKAHINAQNTLFLVQHNIPTTVDILLDSKTLFKEKIEESLQISVQIHHSEFVLFPLSNQQFQMALRLELYNALKDFYAERIYFSEDSFVEKSLKLHFSPIDTIIKGKVFLPDPLSSSGEEYGGNYQDAFKKDTAVLVIKTIPNLGQSPVLSGENTYTYRGISFNVQNASASNAFTEATIFFVFENIYLDINNTILGYNTAFIDDTLGFKTQIVIEDFPFAELSLEQIEVETIGDKTSGIFSLENTKFKIDDFSIPLISPVVSNSPFFDFNRSHKGFEAFNTLFHLNNFNRYIEELGFTQLDPQKVIIDVHGNDGADNSFFTNSPSPRLVFGDGGVDDAEDADVIIHEYTHALSYFASPNSNDGNERRALDEALGDYFASSYSAQYSPLNINDVFTWDGHNEFWAGRITNSDSTYLAYNAAKSIYFNAQIWSATLMDIFNTIGKEKTDILVLESLFYNEPNSTFTQAAQNLLLIDSLLFNEQYKCALYKILKQRKFVNEDCIGNKILDSEGLYVFNSAQFTHNDGEVTFAIFENDFQKMNVDITNVLGQKIMKINDLLEPSFVLSAKDFNEGIYYVRIVSNNKKVYKYKIMKN